MNTKLLALVALGLAACATDEAIQADTTQAETPVAIAAPPGPGGLTLDIDGKLDSTGTYPLTFSVTGAQPGQNIQIAYGTAEQPGTVCPSGLAPVCIDLQNPRPIAPLLLTADAQGRAQRTGTPPAGLFSEGQVVYFQAIGTGAGGAAPASSNVVPKFDALDTAASMFVNVGQIANVDAGAGTIDGYWFEAYFSENLVDTVGDPLDVCILTNTFTSDPVGTTITTPCPGCDFAFETTYGAWDDESYSGDCLAYLGLDVATLPPQDLPAVAYDADYYYAGGAYPTILTYDPTIPGWDYLVVFYPGPTFYDPATGDFAWAFQAGTLLPY